MARGDRELRVVIVGDSTSAQRAVRGLQTATAKMQPDVKAASQAFDEITSALTNRLGPGANVAKNALDKVGASALASGGALKAGIVGGVAAAGAALALFAAKGIQEFGALADKVEKFSQVSGISAENSSRLIAVLDNLGIGAERGERAMNRLALAASDGGKKLGEQGVAIARTAEGSEDLFGTLLNVADAFNAEAAASERAEIANAAFGRGLAQEMIPFLSLGRKKLEELFADVPNGLVLFEEDLAKQQEFEDALNGMHQSFQSLSVEAGRTLIPFVTSVVDAIAIMAKFGSDVVDVVQKIDDAVPDWVKTVGKTLAVNLAGPLAQAGAAIVRFGKDSHEADKAVRALIASQRERAMAEAEAEAALMKTNNALISALGSEVALERARNAASDAVENVTTKEREYAEAQADVGKVATAGAASIVKATKARVQAAKSLTDAQEELADVQEQNAEDIRQANEAVADSERALADANRSAQDAQEDLTEARREAAETLEDLRLAVEGNALAEERALLKVEEARNNLGKAQGTAAELSRAGRDAALDVREAEHELAEVREKGADDAARLAELEARGVEGSDSVIDARQRVADAEYAVVEAQKQVQESTRNVAKTHEEAADRIIAAQDRIRDAQDALSDATTNVKTVTQAAADAQEAAHRKVETAAKAVRDAHVGVKDAALGAAAAAVKLKEDQLAVDGATLGARDKLDLFRVKLGEVVGQANGPTHDALMGLIKDLEAVGDAFGLNAEAGQLLALALVANGPYKKGANAEAHKFLPRRHGGPVQAGRAYLVGEEGPEPFIPDVNGRILPYVPGSRSSAARGGDGVAMGNVTNVTVNAQTNADPYDIAHEVDWQLRTRY